MPREMTPAQFKRKWLPAELSERAASQEHFLDLCTLLGQPTPAEVDSTGAEYAFEKGVAVTDGASKGARGEHGFADVWWRGKFAWEYKRKGKHRTLTDAYRQLSQYREALENPPLLVVSDIARTEIHTNFTGTAKVVHEIPLEEIDAPEHLDKLRRLFTDPDSFRPETTSAAVTEQVAKQFATLASILRARGCAPHETAHFLMKCMFCLFAEDVELLPNHVFEKLLHSLKADPARLKASMDQLFAQMKTGGMFGVEDIKYFNGGLFDDAPALELTPEEVEILLTASKYDWGSVEPAIFGTLFERSLDPNTRAQIGAHYTSREDIMLVVEPVILQPLRREWAAVRENVEALVERRNKAKTKKTKARVEAEISRALDTYIERISTVRILDPACGSGNFLYVAIQQLLDLEKEVITFAARPDIAGGLFPQVRPTQLHGIEINLYAAELAQVVIWIGYLQWMRDNGFIPPNDPILEPLQTIENRDAILAWEDEQGDPIRVWREGATCRGPAEWPDAHFIIGNPPFLGSKLFRQQGLEDPYIEAMFEHYDLPNTVDLCCYWFEMGRRHMETFGYVRAGLLATQGIRGGANRSVLEKIYACGQIFMAWSDRKWILDGAAVHVSIVAFSNVPEEVPTLDGAPANEIYPDLTASMDLTSASRLSRNRNIAFMGDTKGGAFDLPWEEARATLTSPNPTAEGNEDVLRPWRNGLDITRRERSYWIIDYGCERVLDEAALFERPFELLEVRVRPARAKNRRRAYAERWWIHVEPRPAMRGAIDSLRRFLATPTLTKHRLFSWMSAKILPDHQLIAFARSDDYFFGVLHSSIHEMWARRMGTQLREAESGFRYTPTSCFETFALPWSPGKEEEGHAAHGRISEAARVLNEQRERWLNPPEWIDPIAEAVDAEDDFADVPEEARALIRHSAIMARAARDKRLKKRTLTNLYNERPTWLKLAHAELDRAVLAAYAATDPDGDWDEDWAEVWIETGAGRPLPDDHDLAEHRAEIDQRVLANLLRLNQDRAGNA